jgi:hypothetical protein
MLSFVQEGTQMSKFNKQPEIASLSQNLDFGGFSDPDYVIMIMIMVIGYRGRVCVYMLLCNKQGKAKPRRSRCYAGNYTAPKT